MLPKRNQEFDFIAFMRTILYTEYVVNDIICIIGSEKWKISFILEFEDTVHFWAWVLFYVSS